MTMKLSEVLKDYKNSCYLFRLFNVFWYYTEDTSNVFGFVSSQKVLNIIYSGNGKKKKFLSSSSVN